MVTSIETGDQAGTPPACLAVARPVLSISNSVNVPVPAPGQNVDYTITISNPGTGTGNTIVVRDTIDKAYFVVPPVSIGQGGVWVDPYIEWTVASIPPSSPPFNDVYLMYTVQIASLPPGGTPVCNNAGVTKEDGYERCLWTLPAAMPACFMACSDCGDLLKACCTALPCAIGSIFPLPPTKKVPGPPGKVIETGLTDTTNPLCFYQIVISPDVTMKVTKSTAAPPNPDELEINY
jgi:uncharacterized repeat protein (TIGR01451 family)